MGEGRTADELRTGDDDTRCLVARLALGRVEDEAVAFFFFGETRRAGCGGYSSGLIPEMPPPATEEAAAAEEVTFGDGDAAGDSAAARTMLGFFCLRSAVAAVAHVGAVRDGTDAEGEPLMGEGGGCGW